ncbi:MAG: VenA family class IV lanthipeptide [Pseudonocardiaceae bacterium]
MNNVDLVYSLQALPETDPVELDGIQFGPTCVNAQGGNSGCAVALVTAVAAGGILQTLVGGIGVLAPGC